MYEYITCKLFIPKLRLVVRSVLFILCSPDLRGGRSVLTRRLIIRFTCVICKHDGIIGRVNMFGGMMPLFLFIFHIFITYIHSYNHIHTIHLSVAIRWGPSPFLHRLFAQWGNLPVVPSRESNSGLPYSKPTRYQLSHGWICDPCPDFTLFYLSLTGIDVCLSTAQIAIAIASLKVREKQAGCRICLV
jgi:hypothetical protein